MEQVLPGLFLDSPEKHNSFSSHATTGIWQERAYRMAAVDYHTTTGIPAGYLCMKTVFLSFSLSICLHMFLLSFRSSLLLHGCVCNGHVFMTHVFVSVYCTTPTTKMHRTWINALLPPYGLLDVWVCVEIRVRHVSVSTYCLMHQHTCTHCVCGRHDALLCVYGCVGVCVGGCVSVCVCVCVWVCLCVWYYTLS